MSRLGYNSLLIILEGMALAVLSRIGYPSPDANKEKATEI